ncbi:MAG: MFS transporter [Bilifractor sp.]
MNSVVDTSRVDKLRWVMVMAMILVGMTSAYLNAISAYIGPFMEKGWDPTIVVVAFSVMTFMSLPGSIVGGAVKAKFGNKLVLKLGGLGFALTCVATTFVTGPWGYVVLMGGVAPFFVYCVYVVQMANVGELFPDKRGMATGIFVAGIAVASALILPLTEWMTRNMDAMMTIAVSGIVYGGFTLLMGFIMIDAPANYKPKGWEPKEYEILDESVAAEGTGVVDLKWNKVLMKPSFWMIFIGSVGLGIMSSGLYSNFIGMASNLLSISDAKAAWLYSLFTLVTGASGIVIGLVSDKLTGPTKALALAFVLTTAAIALFCGAGGNSLPLYIVFLVVAGIAMGSIQTLTPPIIMNAWGNKYFGITYGIMLTSTTVASFIGAQFSVRYSPVTFLWIAAACLLAGGVLIFLATFVLNKELGKKIF